MCKRAGLGEREEDGIQKPISGRGLARRNGVAGMMQEERDGVFEIKWSDGAVGI